MHKFTMSNGEHIFLTGGEVASIIQDLIANENLIITDDARGVDYTMFDEINISTIEDGVVHIKIGGDY